MWIHARFDGLSVGTASVFCMSSDLLDLDAAGLLAAATEAERAGRLAEVRKFELLSAWAGRDPLERSHRGP